MVDPTAFARVGAPDIRPHATTSMLASHMGAKEQGLEQQAEQTKQGLLGIAQSQEVRAVETAEEKEQQDEQIRVLIEQAWEQDKSQNQEGYMQTIQQISAIDPKQAKTVHGMIGAEDKTKRAIAGGNFHAASMQEDVTAQNTLLKNAWNSLQDKDGPLATFLYSVMSAPPGEREELYEDGNNWLKQTGIFDPSKMQAKTTPSQKMGGYLIRKPDGTVALATGVFDPDTETLKTVTADFEEGTEVLTAEGETLDEKTARRLGEKISTEQIQAAVKMQTEFGKKYEAAQENLGILDNAIGVVDKAVKEGDWTGTGPIEKYMPKIKKTAILINNLRSQFGLSIIQAGKFGQLTEKELDVAFETGLPEGLDGPDLLEFLKNKRSATEKLANLYAEATAYVGTVKPESEGGGFYTIPDWIAKRSGGAAPATGAAPAAPAVGGGAKRMTQEEFNAAPSGTPFIAPDGTTRTKP